jgi:hypothetical protein
MSTEKELFTNTQGRTSALLNRRSRRIARFQCRCWPQSRYQRRSCYAVAPEHRAGDR